MVKKIPLRMCIACREMKNKNELIRIVGNKEGNVTIDLKGKLNGRGAYLCQNSICIAQALKTGKLNRALQMPVPDTIWEELTKLVKNQSEGNG